MRLDIKRILNVPGSKVDLDFCVSQERLDEVKHVTFASPVRVNGAIENHAGRRKRRIMSSLRQKALM